MGFSDCQIQNHLAGETEISHLLIFLFHSVLSERTPLALTNKIIISDWVQVIAILLVSILDHLLSQRLSFTWYLFIK